MVDVCCLCGDVGFPDKLFQCTRCRHRFQHSYCSNYYREEHTVIQVCDWCESEGRRNSSPTNAYVNVNANANDARSPYSAHRLKKHDGAADKSAGKTSSSRPAIRRYKLLKDVMC